MYFYLSIIKSVLKIIHFINMFHYNYCQITSISGITKILFKEEYKKYVNTGEVSSILSILFDVMKLPIEARTEEVFQVPDAQQVIN